MAKGRCSRCGKGMELKKGSLPADQRTCHACRRQRRGPYHPNGLTVQVHGIRTCAGCRRTFRLTSQWQKFCGWDCRTRAQRVREAARPSSSQRGYGPEHARLRARWKPAVDAGEVNCWRCNKWLGDIPWDLGHDDYDKSVYRGPECLSCNRGTPNRLKARRGKVRRAAA